MEQIHYIQDELYHIKQTLYENLEALIARGESIEELTEKTELLEKHSAEFKKGATQIQRNQWWAKNRIKLAIGSITSAGLICGLLCII